MAHVGEKAAGRLGTRWGIQMALLLLATLVLATLIGMAVYQLASHT